MSVWINAPHFCCGVWLNEGRVDLAPPIVKYMIGWTAEQVEFYCRKKNWKTQRLP